MSQNKTGMSQVEKEKHARLRLMKERNENYLAERREEHEAEQELTRELRVLNTA